MFELRLQLYVRLYDGKIVLSQDKILLESQQQVSEEVSVQRLSMVSNIYLINNIDKL